MIDMETAVMELIINAGEARSCAMQALYAARKYQWDQVDILLAESQLAAKRAHATQTELIGFDEGEGKLPVSLIMVHAQDHIMNAMLARDLVEELVRIYRLLEQNGVQNA